MQWDLSDLQSRSKRLFELLEIETNSTKREALIHDINTLEGMICYAYGNNTWNQERDYSGYDTLSDKKLFDEIMKMYKDNSHITNDILLRLNKTNIPYRLAYNKGMKQEEYFELLDVFFKDYDSEHLRIFRSLIDSNRIHFSSKDYLGHRFNGIANTIITDNVQYVVANYNRRVNYSEVLVHEIGHVYQFEGISISDIETNQFMSYSMFREAYAMFLEYVYFDYLKKTKYSKYASELEKTQLGDFMCHSEYYFDSLMGVKNSDIDKSYFVRDEESKISNDVLRYFYSCLMSIYLINSYRRDKSKTMKEIETINDLYRSKEEEKLLRLINPDDYISSHKEVIRKLYI